jgi:cytochrome c peroxidase
VKKWSAAYVAFVACLSVMTPSAADTGAVDFFAGRLPPWVPPPKVPADNPITDAKVDLGRRLFYDTRLSGNRTFSCASCHQQSLAFTDGRARAIGSTGAVHPRSSMSLANVAYNASFGWVDHVWSLETQMEVPMYNERPIELGLKGRDEEVIARFTANADDMKRFEAAFPGEQPVVTIPNIIKAIASFERVLISANSAFDRYLYKDDRSGMSPAALRGVDLFFSDRLHCSECHSSFNLSGPTAFNGTLPSAPEAFFHNTGVSTGSEAFRAPTLRNVAVTAPYMHDGSLRTLADVVGHYARGGTPGPNVSPLVRGFAISPSELSDLVAFLESLTDEEFLKNPAFGDPH